MYNNIFKKTIMSKFFILSLFTFIVSFDCHINAQEYPEWLSGSSAYWLETMNLEYRHPKGYISNGNNEEINIRSKSGEWICTNYPTIYTDDKFFITYDIIPITTREDSALRAKMFPGTPDVIDKQHIYQLRSLLRSTIGEDASESWKNYVTYLPEEEAKRKFNADTVITYSVSFEKDYYFRDKYSNCKIYFIQRKGRGFVPIFCFFDEKAFKEQKKYLKAAESIFWYGDAEPDWEMLKRKADAEQPIIIPYGKLKSNSP